MLNRNSPATASWRTWGLIGIALVLVRLPFAATHHYQEDAFITFRTAFNFADHGQFAFNLGESTSGATSILYTFWVALLRGVFHSLTLPAVTAANTVMALIACWLLATSLERGAARWPLWITTAVLPVSLVLSYTGMETPMLCVALGGAAYGLRHHFESRALPAAVLVLPLVRPDAVAFAAIFIAACFLINRRRSLEAAVCLGLGLALLAGFNYAISGSFITSTAQAKLVSYHPDHSLPAIFHRIVVMFFQDSFLVPIETKFLEWLSPVATVVTVTASVLALRYAWSDVAQRVTVAAMIAGVFAVPLAYACGGVIFSWYLWPSTWMANSLALFVILRWAQSLARKPHNAVWGAVAAALTLCALLQWAISYNIGTQEYRYRADVGRYLATIRRPGDTLFLEPAGYIPFFSGLKTWDEVGLVSSDVVAAEVAHPVNWWPIFVKEKEPTWLVERPSVLDRGVTNNGYVLTTEEIAWLHSHYEVVRRFTYVPTDYATSWIGKKLLSLGSHSGYDVLHLKAAGPVQSPPQS